MTLERDNNGLGGTICVAGGPMFLLQGNFKVHIPPSCSVCD
jgi:hypothetical protein